MEHGKLSSYTNKSCRCDECKTVAMAYFKKSAEARKAKGLPDGDERHGTKNGYLNYGCRCGECKVAHTDPKLAIEPDGFGYRVWIREERAWFTVGARVT